MYKIGEFSKITNMTIKTLRYYDKESILVPEFRDENGYRYYSEENFKKAEIINILRELEFSIAEMKDVIENCDDTEDLKYYLEDKKEIVNNQIKERKKLLKKIDTYIEKEKIDEEIKNMYKIEKKKIEDINVLSNRFTGSVAKSGDVIPKLYKDIKLKVNGDMFTLYYEMEKEEERDLEICVPVKSRIESENGKYRTINGGEYLATTHIGPYENLNKAYKELIDYAKENNIELGLPAREICKKGPGMIFKGNPEKYITEIMFPIVK